MKPKRNILIFLSFLLFASTLVQISGAVGPIPDTKEKYPSWSPDGQKILFVSYGVMSEGMFLIKPDGSEIQKIRGGIEPSWTPDGNIIMINIFNGSRDIVHMDIETQNITRLTFNGNSVAENVPKYSPDGGKIAFEGDSQIGSNIYVKESYNSDVKKIAEYARFPEWSPEGDKLVYYCYEPFSIWVINPNGTGKKKIFNDYSYSISFNIRWTPDSKYLLLNNGSNTITKVNISDPTDIEYIYDPVAHWDPEYSPDGKYVTFVSSMDGGNPDLFVARSNGSDLHRLVYDTNPQTPFDPSYFSKIDRPVPPPWPTPEPTPVVISTAEPVNTSAAEQTPSIPGFSALAVFMILILFVSIKRMNKIGVKNE